MTMSGGRQVGSNPHSTCLIACLSCEIFSDPALDKYIIAIKLQIFPRRFIELLMQVMKHFSHLTCRSGEGESAALHRIKIRRLLY